MSNTKLILIAIVFCILILIKINILQCEIYNVKKIKCNENFSLDDSLDAQAMQNFISLAKGGNVNISSLNITGDVKISGKLNVINDITTDGHLSVKNGSDFSGGTHTFKDVESKNNQYIRIGNPWGIPGIYVPDNAPLVIGNNGVQNLHMHGGELNINNNVFRIKENKIQYIPGNYELNFNKDDTWIRSYKIDTAEYRGGFASGVMWTSSKGYI